jgi:predicted AAA+ superfamily ATPase
VDEVQKVPELLDEVHGLIERYRVRFILAGSSARKLRRRAPICSRGEPSCAGCTR